MGDKRGVVMSGMRPTGKLHMGNYWGALRNWVKLQEERDCFFCVADWHMFTTGYETTGNLQVDVRDMVRDWLAAGIDPERCVVFQQSRVPEHAELALLLSMITPISWLENNPTYKEQLQELGKTKLTRAAEGVLSQENREKVSGARLEEVAPAEGAARLELRTHGFLGYPVLQTADIVLYGADQVPVGIDQAPHVEISREIVRRFNSIYGDVLAEPRVLLTPTAKVPGLDARKMSKSYGNTLQLCETPESLKTKVMSMYTDPLKVRAKDKGHPEGCVVYAFHRLYSDFADRREVECREGLIGCVACKQSLLGSMNAPCERFLGAREAFPESSVDAILEAGSRKAREVAGRTLERVRRAMNLRAA